MPKRVTTHDGDVLDELVWRHYGRSEVIPAVLAANPQLAQLHPVLEAGRRQLGALAAEAVPGEQG